MPCSAEVSELKLTVGRSAEKVAEIERENQELRTAIEAVKMAEEGWRAEREQMMAERSREVERRREAETRLRRVAAKVVQVEKENVGRRKRAEDP